MVCRVLNGGALGEHQGINLPGTNVSIPSLTEKDEADLDFGLKQGVDVDRHLLRAHGARM